MWTVSIHPAKLPLPAKKSWTDPTRPAVDWLCRNCGCRNSGCLPLRSLELRRQRIDLLFTYKQIFGLIDLDVSDLFRLRCDNRNRGHQYKLFQSPDLVSDITSIPIEQQKCGMIYQLTVLFFNFSSLNSFKRSLTPSFLTRHSAVYFF